MSSARLFYRLGAFDVDALYARPPKRRGTCLTPADNVFLTFTIPLDKQQRSQANVSVSL